MGGFYAVLRALVLRTILRDRLRTSLTVAGIGIGVAVLVAIQLANQGALQTFRESVDLVAGRANYQIAAGAFELDERVLLSLRPFWREGVRFAPVIDVEGSLANGEPVRILGVDLLSDIHFRDYRYARVLSDARAATAQLPSTLALFQHDSAVVSQTFARSHDLELGEKLLVDAHGSRGSLTIRGILETEGPATAFNGAIVIVDIAAAQEQFALVGKVTRVDLIVPSHNESRLLERIAGALPDYAKIERPSRRNERVEDMLRAFRVNLLALSGVALLVAVFLVYNTVLISVLRRRREVGIIKTLGATPRQITGAFLTEAALLAVAGSAAGLALGVFLARRLVVLVGRTVSSLYTDAASGTIELTPEIAASALLTGTLTSIVAALQPSIEAGRIPPNLLIRPGIYQRLSQRRPLRLILGSIGAFIAAAAATRIPAVNGISLGGYLAVTCAAAAVALAAPLALTVTSTLLASPLRRLFGAVGLLASRAATAALRRTGVATAALSISIGMMVAVALMVGSFRETVRVWVGQTVRSDLWIRPANTLSGGARRTFPETITAVLEALPVIEAIDRFRGRTVIYRDALVSLGSGDFDVATSHGSLPMIAPRSAGRALREAMRQRGAVVSESFARKFDHRVGDVITLPTPGGGVSVPITGVYRDYSSDRGVIVIPRTLYVRLFDDRAIDTISIFLRDGVPLESGRQAIERAVGKRFGAFTFANAEIRREVMRVFDQTFSITYVLLIVAIIVAVLGIVNTLSAFILEREHEIATLQTLGMTARQIRMMLLLESLVIAICSIILGILTGIVLSWILIYVINVQSFGWTIEFHPPYAMLVGSLAITFIATLAAGLLPARSAGRNLAAALERE